MIVLTKQQITSNELLKNGKGEKFLSSMQIRLTNKLVSTYNVKNFE